MSESEVSEWRVTVSSCGGMWREVSGGQLARVRGPDAAAERARNNRPNRFDADLDPTAPRAHACLIRTRREQAARTPYPPSNAPS